MMKSFKVYRNIGWVLLLLIISISCSPPEEYAAGKLFIIGGGERSDALIEKMMITADLKDEDYVFVLPMASSIPDTVTQYISEQMLVHGDYKIKSHNFKREEAQEEEELIEEVVQAKLIYIPGGDQNRFMEVVDDTPLFTAIRQAYKEGATIAGTSAGAAVMSEIMLTGEQKINKNKEGVDVIWKDNVETGKGLGFLEEDIIDQHFIRRSRFNRLLSVLADHPDKQAIGIDESTALICANGKAEVVGEGQVVVFSQLQKLDVTTDKLIGFEEVRFSLFKEGDQFELFTKK